MVRLSYTVVQLGILVGKTMQGSNVGWSHFFKSNWHLWMKSHMCEISFLLFNLVLDLRLQVPHSAVGEGAQGEAPNRIFRFINMFSERAKD